MVKPIPTTQADTYLDKKQFVFKLNGKGIPVISKPGLPDWDQLPPATDLLATYSEFDPSDKILHYGCHHGALSAYIAQNLTTGYLSITDHNSIALEMTRHTLQTNHFEGLITSKWITLSSEVEPTGQELGNYEVVLIQLPKGRALSRRWLLQAYLALRDAGSLYLGGSNDAGIQSTIKDASDLFGNATIRGYKKGSRVAQMVKMGSNDQFPEWASTPGIKPGSWVEFSIPIKGKELKINSLPGVFSSDRLDPGTAMLIENLEIPPESTVLDVGCGYGILGMFASLSGAAKVDLVDNNFLATASARRNIALNHIEHASVITGDMLEPVISNKYDLVLSNPPFHAGHSVDYAITASMIEQSYQALNPSGKLVLVANRFIPYHHMIKHIFGNIATLVESRDYHILSGIK